MKYELRNYQAESSARSVAFLQQPLENRRGNIVTNNGILVIPTGGGKSLVLADIVTKLNSPSIVFQPSKEILEQNYDKLKSYGYTPSIFSASVGEKKIGRLTLATIGSVIRKPEAFRHVRHIFIDECHLSNAKDGESMYNRFFSAMPQARVLGLTATPYRLVTDGFGGSQLKFLTRTRPRIFQKVVHVVQNGDLFRDGYLAKLEYKQVKTGFREDRLRLNSTGADYTEESMRNLFRELSFSDQIVRCVLRLQQLDRGGTLLFTRFVEEAEYVASKIPGAAVVTGKTPKTDRQRIIEGFKAGRIPLVANVGVFVVGFDYPELMNVILASPTKSLARYYQMVGRVVRTHPSKDVAYVIDMVGMMEKFGRVEDLKLVEGDHEKWHVESNGKQLTNVYFGEPPNRFIPKGKQPPPSSKYQISLGI